MIFGIDAMRFLYHNGVLFLFVLLFLPGLSSAEAATGTIKGTVQDSETEEPVSYVYLKLEDIPGLST